MPTTNIITQAGAWMISADTNYQGYQVNLETRETIPTGKRVFLKWETLASTFPDLVWEKSFLDLGCSQGFFLFKAWECGAVNIMGVEASREYYQELLPYTNKVARIGLANATFPHLPPGTHADVVMCLSLVHHLFPAMSLEEILVELAEITDETLIVEFINGSDKMVQRKGWIGAHPEYTLAVFLDAAKANFSQVWRLGEGHHDTRTIFRMDK